VRPGKQSGQIILQKIHWLISVLHKRGCEITLRWIPAHVGVPGNETADWLAKTATGWKAKRSGKDPLSLPLPIVDPQRIMKMTWLPQLLSSCKRMIKQHTRDCWGGAWRNGVTGMLYKKRWQDGSERLDRHINKLYQNLTHKAEASVLIQMRTEKIGLHGYLYQINRSDNPWCGCRQAYQTVRHIIEDCEFLGDLRGQYLGTDSISDARIFLSHTELTSKTAKFMLATGLLGQFAGFKTLSPLE
jgi:hypothetical protein